MMKIFVSLCLFALIVRNIDAARFEVIRLRNERRGEIRRDFLVDGTSETILGQGQTE